MMVNCPGSIEDAHTNNYLKGLHVWRRSACLSAGVLVEDTMQESYTLKVLHNSDGMF